MAEDAFARLVRNAGSVTAVEESAPLFSGSVNGRQPYPLDQWNPSNCGFVDIAIDRDGRWFHEGSEIKRVELVSLFAGLLRREDDGAYYLVTPVEKVEVAVALHPLMVVDATRVDDTSTGQSRLGTYPQFRRCFLPQRRDRADTRASGCRCCVHITTE